MPRYPSAAELEILVALKEHHYLTVEQVMLLTGRTSLRAAQQRLTDLATAGLVAKHDRRSSNVLKPLRAGWSLTGKSKAYLEHAEMVVLPPRRPRPYTLDHLLLINDVLIRGRVLARNYPNVIDLMEVYHDRELRAWTPSLSVVPDGYLHFTVKTAKSRLSVPTFIEADMGTMDRHRWQEKVSRYLRFFEHDLPDQFDTDVATVAVIVQDEEKRIRDLKRWTEQELTRRDAKSYGEIFYFTQLTDDLSAEDVFLSPRFQVAFASHTETLLPLRLDEVSTPRKFLSV